MSDPHPAEEQIGAEQPRTHRFADADNGVSIEVLDGLISWAIARADAAVDEICAYLADRPPIRGWQGDYPGETFPYLGRGHDRDCAALRRRLRSQHGWAPRPMGAVRPPRRGRVP